MEGGSSGGHTYRQRGCSGWVANLGDVHTYIHTYLPTYVHTYSHVHTLQNIGDQIDSQIVNRLSGLPMHGRISGLAPAALSIYRSLLYRVGAIPGCIRQRARRLKDGSPHLFGVTLCLASELQAFWPPSLPGDGNCVGRRQVDARWVGREAASEDGCG